LEFVGIGGVSNRQCQQGSFQFALIWGAQPRPDLVEAFLICGQARCIECWLVIARSQCEAAQDNKAGYSHGLHPISALLAVRVRSVRGPGQLTCPNYRTKLNKWLYE
jgi:hypothetical protein